MKEQEGLNIVNGQTAKEIKCGRLVIDADSVVLKGDAEVSELMVKKYNA